MRDVVERLIRSGANKLIVVDRNHRPTGILTIMDLVNAVEKLDAGQTVSATKPP
jgi:predicted transcriptional regulator